MQKVKKQICTLCNSILTVAFIIFMLAQMSVAAEDKLTVTRSFDPEVYEGESIVTVTISVTGEAALMAFSFQETLPNGWTFEDYDTPKPQPAGTPDEDDEGDIEFFWTKMPTLPYTFSYTVKVPSDASGDYTWSGVMYYAESGDTEEVPVGGTQVLKEKSAPAQVIPIITWNDPQVLTYGDPMSMTFNAAVIADGHDISNLGNFVYKATIDNVSDTKDYYFEIAPISALDEDKTINDFNALIYSTNWDYDGPVKNPYAFTSFEEQSVATMRGKGYNRWKISQPFKYDIYYNFATAKMTIVPNRTTTIGSAGYTTWSNGEKYKVTGATAYTVTDQGTYVQLNAQEAGIVYPAGTGLILAGSGDVTISAVASDATPATISSNALSGTGNSSASIAANCYVLWWDGTNASSVGFKKTTAGTLAAHKAYIPASPTAPEFLGFSFGETTDLREKVIVKSEKFLSEESVARNATAPVYNLNGQRVMNPSKGLYIVNGKKVVMK